MIELNKNNFKEITTDSITIIDFWGPSCGPCKALKPIMDEISDEYSDNEKVNICTLNCEEEAELAVEFKIRSLPTIICYSNEEVKFTLIGVQSRQEIIDMINKCIEEN
jgi:thioredoxin 1